MMLLSVVLVLSGLSSVVKSNLNYSSMNWKMIRIVNPRSQVQIISILWRFVLKKLSCDSKKGYLLDPYHKLH